MIGYSFGQMKYKFNSLQIAHMQKIIFLFLIILIPQFADSQTNLIFNINYGVSKRNVDLSLLNDSSKNIIKNNELPNKSFSIGFGIEKKIYKHFFLLTGLSYHKNSFKTKRVRFAPYYVSSGYADSTGYQIEIEDKTLAIPINIAYEMYLNKKNTIQIISGLDLLYKLDQKTMFTIRSIYETSSSVWQTPRGVFHDGQNEYKYSFQLPIRLLYTYTYKRIGIGFNAQYVYVLGKTNTQVTSSGYGYIGIKEETSGRMSFLNLGISLLYKLSPIKRRK